jgi:hypothetical protein
MTKNKNRRIFELVMMGEGPKRENISDGLL